MISIIVITEKNEKLSDYKDTRFPKGTFRDKFNPDIDSFTDEPVV